MTDDWKKRGAALFDMDGTLLPWDTQYVFFLFCGEAPSLETLADFSFPGLYPALYFENMG
ncbi:haloacid dehalogenase-like hydrolase [Akkermansia muciniphila]|uniref:haloacid dehalogenase-like hydrolase n=1 Tax=Akkermansia muciniphila TaxID=239935 RepID=UPI00211DDA55|nr:haloacid dehalogenase-like hydrolase [Akkermansia muciniphila]